MARIPTEPSWPWITHESGAISASPLETVFNHDENSVQEFGDSAAKRQKLSTGLGKRYLSRYSIGQEKSSDSLRRYSHQLALSVQGRNMSPMRLGHQTSLLDERNRTFVLHPIRPPFASRIHKEQSDTSDKSAIPAIRETRSVAITSCAASQISSNGVYHFNTQR